MCEGGIQQEENHLSHSLSCSGSVPTWYLSSDHILTCCHSCCHVMSNGWSGSVAFDFHASRKLRFLFLLFFFLTISNDSALWWRVFWYLCKEKTHHHNETKDVVDQSRRFHTRCLPHAPPCMKPLRHACASLEAEQLCFCTAHNNWLRPSPRWRVYQNLL